MVDKIWPSLQVSEQELLGKEHEDLNEAVQNTFNSAKSQEAFLEENASLWKSYSDLLNVLQSSIAKAELPEEPASTLAAVRSNFCNVQNALSHMQVRFCAESISSIR